MSTTYSAKKVVIGQAAANALLGALTTGHVGGLLATGKLRLSHDPSFNPTPQSTLASLSAQEANFSGYPAGGVAVSLTTGLNLSPNAQGASQAALFEAAAATPFVADNITGWWIDDGTIFWVGERFAAGLIAGFAAVGDFLELIAIIPELLTQATS
jgi:hypothetical protein